VDVERSVVPLHTVESHWFRRAEYVSGKVSVDVLLIGGHQYMLVL
jgi:hypothetical protein